ncbi:MAG: tRNA guanosine(34) transglycosylase Tgt [Planctomycetes bacterium]|nr:tRNA guanosine(34) transglycosylase Tgt [Planctomycetota bacterium]MCH8858507.1 tRNA guanosine(34) transglycosylase Tgt [Pseudomonadota bacterium]
MALFPLTITHTDGAARCGVYHTPHGDVDTPAFMPVGTAGTVKGVTPPQLAGSGTQMILANTYHLQLRPTADVVRELGGLHAFMGWSGPILTDSGGYQVFSLAKISKITDEGVEFRSHIDGAAMSLGPATAVSIQNALGADVIMAFDECPPLPSDGETIARAVRRTVRWAAQCKQCHARSEDQALFAIVQGGLDPDLRRRCAEALVDIEFDGYAVGGLSVGETHEEMVSVLGPAISALPPDRPRYLMGVGMPRDLLAAVQAGVDLFDCVLPTRNGRNSQAFTGTGRLNMRNERYRLDSGPLEADCDCETCGRFSRGYIRHLFNAGEMLGPTLTSIHNLRFFQRFMTRMRELIRTGDLAEIVTEFPIAAGPAQHQQEESP